MSTQNLRRLICAILLLALPGTASAALITYGFFGLVSQQALPTYPVRLSDPVGGYIQYNTDASSSGDVGAYFDPEGLIVADFGDTSIIGLGLQIQITRINAAPIFTLSRIGFLSETLFVQGTNEPLDYMSLSFIGPDPLALPSYDLPSEISQTLNAQLFVASPDIPPVSGMEPPRSGFFTAASLDFFPIVTVPAPSTLWLIALLLVSGISSRRPRVTGVGTNSD